MSGIRRRGGGVGVAQAGGRSGGVRKGSGGSASLHIPRPPIESIVMFYDQVTYIDILMGEGSYAFESY